MNNTDRYWYQRKWKSIFTNEAHKILVTKGLYNCPFTRKYRHGFSIDVKSELRTPVASGIIAVKVSGRRGPALLFLDLRRGVLGRVGLSHTVKAEANH